MRTTTEPTPSTPELDTTAATAGHLRHRAACDGPRVHRFVGKHGDEIERCTCGAWQVVTTAEELRTAQPHSSGSTTATGQNWTRWRCREHGKPVNWRGRGCPDCRARGSR